MILALLFGVFTVVSLIVGGGSADYGKRFSYLWILLHVDVICTCLLVASSGSIQRGYFLAVGLAVLVVLIYLVSDNVISLTSLFESADYYNRDTKVDSYVKVCGTIESVDKVDKHYKVVIEGVKCSFSANTNLLSTYNVGDAVEVVGRVTEFGLCECNFVFDVRDRVLASEYTIKHSTFSDVLSNLVIVMSGIGVIASYT